MRPTTSIRFLNPFLRLAGCIPITPRRAKDAMRAAADRIRAGEIVCVFPEGQLSRSGTLLRLRRGYELIARQAEAPVVPVWMDELWGSIFSFKGGRFFSKWPKQWPYPVAVAFGQPLSAEQADIATVREELLKLGEICYSNRAVLREHLAYACLRGLKRKPFGTAIIDGLDNSTLSRGKLLGVATALARASATAMPERSAHRDRSAAGQGRRGGERRRHAGGESSGEPELHELARSASFGAKPGRAAHHHLRAPDGEEAGELPLDGRDGAPR